MNALKFSFSKANKIGALIGLAIGCLGAASLFLILTVQHQNSNGKKDKSFAITTRMHNLLSPMLSHGEATKGHEDLMCTSCHETSDGTIRQQLQAKARNALLNTNYISDFGYKQVESKKCLSCHERPNERHPIHRFNEPRFMGAVKITQANSCIGCHVEHTGQLASIESEGFCSACHKELEMNNDPIDISHKKLIEASKWNTCMGCHDYHGNHNRSVPKIVNSAINVDIIRSYLDGNTSPYGLEKIYEGKIK
jgi:hypothetical protein